MNQGQKKEQKNYLLYLAYDGTDFSGFQKQKAQRTVQKELEKALTDIYHQPIRVSAAGRTDAGVHARGQTVNFHAPSKIPTEKLPWAINTKLPEDVRVWKAELVPCYFHARYHAEGKEYRYCLDRALIYQVMERRYSWHCPYPLDLKEMRRGAEVLQGTYDFRCFQAVGSEVQDTVRTIWRAEVVDEEKRNLVHLFFCGDGFLYKMVRFLAGALVWVGRNRISVEELQKHLFAPQKHPVGNQQGGIIHRPFPALTPEGLCLEKVIYQEQELTEGINGSNSV